MTCFEWKNAPEADFAVIGNPIEHSLSPIMHQAAYNAFNLNYRYLALKVPDQEVADCLDALLAKGYKGVNITVPHKSEALNWAITNADAIAKRIGAANTIRFSDHSAINTDAPAIVETIVAHGLQPGSRILVLGAGGSAKAAWVGLSDAGYHVFATNRTYHRLLEAIDSVDARVQPIQDIYSQEFASVINATSASLSNTSLGIQWHHFAGLQFAFDLAYAAHDTVFVDEAKRAGIAAIDGRELLARQGALAFSYWLDLRAPYEIMLSAIQNR